MDISLAMKNQILVDDIDLLHFTQNKLKQWLGVSVRNRL